MTAVVVADPAWPQEELEVKSPTFSLLPDSNIQLYSPDSDSKTQRCNIITLSQGYQVIQQLSCSTDVLAHIRWLVPLTLAAEHVIVS